MSALNRPEGSHRPPGSRQTPDSDESLVDAMDLVPEQRRASDNLTHWWEGLDDKQRRSLQADFEQWYHESGKSSLMRAGHSICGRRGSETACDAAVKIWSRWPNTRMRELFKTSPRYVYQLVRRLFLDGLEKSYRRHEQSAGLPEDNDDGVWEGNSDEESGWEVRQAINRLSKEQAELIFLLYWLRMNLSEASRHLTIPRREAEKLHKSAIANLKELLKEEA
ncbi:hypothetical protein MED01_006165 [Micromonospora sp. MED01]|uniref:hypothetical protein n=1 Tax=Micromonospora alfalfae TaxID=2911212 RepID=UPI001EE850EB|nr:hypothetical protein [Micromonospora alfalfae]MCG5461307.1 hypothetical protein [Micromonospora alfalfae]